MSVTDDSLFMGARGAYRRARRILAGMAEAGHARRAILDHKMRVLHPGWASEKMQDFIDALNAGDEEKVKGYNLLYAEYYERGCAILGGDK